MKTISDIVHINFQNTDVVILNAFLTIFYKLFYKNNRYIYFSIKNILFFFSIKLCDKIYVYFINYL